MADTFFLLVVDYHGGWDNLDHVGPRFTNGLNHSPPKTNLNPVLLNVGKGEGFIEVMRDATRHVDRLSVNSIYLPRLSFY